MKNEIDLSKAYAGQIAHLANGETDVLLKAEVLNEDTGVFEVLFNNRKNHAGFIYKSDGTKYRDYSFYPDIVALSDPIQVQCARIEGEIEAYENILLTKPAAKTFDFILQKRADTKAKLLTLQNQ